MLLYIGVAFFAPVAVATMLLRCCDVAAAAAAAAVAAAANIDHDWARATCMPAADCRLPI